jgi:hypothetical protein
VDQNVRPDDPGLVALAVRARESEGRMKGLLHKMIPCALAGAAVLFFLGQPSAAAGCVIAAGVLAWLEDEF